MRECPEDLISAVDQVYPFVLLDASVHPSQSASPSSLQNEGVEKEQTLPTLLSLVEPQRPMMLVEVEVRQVEVDSRHLDLEVAKA